MNTSLVVEPKEPGPIVSGQTLAICETISLSAGMTVNLVSVVTNLINIVVFLRQGVMTDSTTISLLALAVSNLLGSAVMIPRPLCFYFAEYQPIKDLIARDCYFLSDMVFAYPHIMFSRITCWITVYISVERALCVLIPFKFRLLLGPKNTIIIMFAIFIFYFIFHIPFGANVRVVLVRDPTSNWTMNLYMNETNLGKIFLKINSLLGTAILTTLAMIIIVVATTVLLVSLRSSRDWRNSLSSKTVRTPASASLPSVASHLSSVYKSSRRDLEISRTVSAITGIYLVCLSASHVPALAVLSLPGMTINGVNSGLFSLMFALKYFFDGLNSAIDLFFYVRMNTKYRKTFYNLFTRKSTKCGIINISPFTTTQS